MTRILVTGGAGFLGSALVRRLVARGDSVRVLDDASRGSFERLADLEGSFEAVSGDVRDAAAVGRAAADCETVYHLAAVNGTRFFYEMPERVLDVALRGTLAAVTAAREAGARRFLLASSSEVYHEPPEYPTPEDVRMAIPDPYNPRYSYAGGKLASELISIHYLAGSGTDCVIFRPHNVYGPVMGFEHVIPQFAAKIHRAAAAAGCAGGTGAERVDRARGADPTGFPQLAIPVQGDGRETRAFCFVEDSAEAIALLGERGAAGTTYNVGREEETSIASLATAVGRALGFQVRVEAGPPAPGAARRRCPKVERLAALGFVARTDLAEGLVATLPFYWDACESGDFPPPE